jgi:hypothetical protein
MRTHRTLIASLAVNVGLAIVWLLLQGRGASRIEAASTSPPQAKASEVLVASAAPPEAIVSNPPPIRFQWAMLDTNDARIYVSNLRRVNCPEHVLRDLLVNKLDKQFRPQLQTAYVNYDPWVGSDRRDADRRVERERVAGLQHEQLALTRELLGYDWNSDVSVEWSREEVAGVFLGFLSDLKAQQVMAQVMGEVQDIEARFKFLEDRIIAEEDLETFAVFRSGVSQQLGRLLRPQELDELETRAQLVLLLGNNIHLEGMDPTGAELRAIMSASRNYQDALTAAILDRFPFRDGPDDDSQRREFEAALRTSLGAARFAEFQRAQEKEFRDAYAFTQRQNLPKSVAVTLYQAQRTAEAQWREITDDGSLSTEERGIALEVLQTATAASLARTLGREFTNYINGNGRWLNQLSSVSPANPARGEARR